MESASLPSNIVTLPPRPSTSRTLQLLGSSPSTSPASSTSSRKRKRGAESPTQLTPLDAMNTANVPFLQSIWRSIKTWAFGTANQEPAVNPLPGRPRSSPARLRLSEDGSSRSSEESANGSDQAIASTATSASFHSFNQTSKRSQGSSVRGDVRLKTPAPIASESTTTTQQLPSPQTSASEDERHLGLSRRPSMRTTPKSNIFNGRVAANPLQKYEEPFYVKPIKRRVDPNDALRRAIMRRDCKPVPALADAAFPSPRSMMAAFATPIRHFPNKIPSRLGLLDRSPTRLTPLTKRRAMGEPSTLRRSTRLASMERTVANGRIEKAQQKRSKKIQESYRKSQLRAAVASEPLDALLRQLQLSKEQGFQSLEEVEQKRRERELEIKKLRAQDVIPPGGFGDSPYPELTAVPKAKKKIRKEKILPLDPARQARMVKTFDEVRKPGLNKTYITKWNIPITNHDFQRLLPNQWLNDEIINFYLNLICERTNSLHPNGPKKVFAHNTYFWSKLKTSGYQAVARWARRAKCGGEEILKLDYLIMPAHVGGNHWCLAVVNFKQKRFEYYDSLGGKFTPESRPQPYILMREYVRQETGGRFDDTNWVDYAMAGAPQQQNMSDCGVFTLKSAEVITRGGRLDFSAKDMPLVRDRMLVEILEGQLLPPHNPDDDDS